MSELKPCPFCGGDPVAIETRPGRGELYCGNCDVVLGGNNAMTAEEWTDAWNARAERTCIAEENSDASYGDCMFVCSECGADLDNERLPNYCPQCGAKVVE